MDQVARKAQRLLDIVFFIPRGRVAGDSLCYYISTCAVVHKLRYRGINKSTYNIPVHVSYPSVKSRQNRPSRLGDYPEQTRLAN